MERRKGLSGRQKARTSAIAFKAINSSAFLGGQEVKVGITRNDTEEATQLLRFSKNFGSCQQGFGGSLKNFKGGGKVVDIYNFLTKKLPGRWSGM